MSAISDSALSRATADYQAKHSKYIIGRKNYSQQYSHLYGIRLKQMTPRIRSLVQEKWGGSVKVLDRIIESEAKDQVNGQCVVIGTLFKEMPLRSSVLDEFKDQNGISISVQPLNHFASKNDYLVLEDDSGRLGLGGKIVTDLVHSVVTGIIVAIKGAVDDQGIFQVSDILFPGESIVSGPFKKVENSTTVTGGFGEGDVANSKYVMLVSGLQMGGSTDASHAHSLQLATQLLMDFVSGRLGCEEDVLLASRIVRVIVAGNSVVPAAGTDSNAGTSRKSNAESTVPMKQFDVMLATALGSCPFDIMPGARDPASHVMPQQPIHPCLLPQSARFTDSLNLVTNPYEAVIDNVAVLGHSGQAVDDIARQTIREVDVDATATATAAMDTDGEAETKGDNKDAGELQGEEPIKILRSTVKWGHLCPTAPDTLSCYPYLDQDPFIIDNSSGLGNVSSRVVFAGNQDAFSYHVEVNSQQQKTLLVCVPSFSKTRQVVLVNLSTLECKPMTFHALDDDEEDAMTDTATNAE